MLFPTIDFAVFFMVVFTGSWVLRPYRRAWRWFILASSCVFYGWWDWNFLYLLLGSIVMNWLFGLLVHRALGPDGERTDASRWLVRLAVVANLGVLGYFKYFEFFITSIAERLQSLGISANAPLLHIVLPIGISFFTFQAISYVIDIGRGHWRQPLPLLDFAVYLSFFAHLVAGPIVRASEFAPQLDHVPDPRYVKSSEAFMLIFRGMFKKVVISSFLATQIVDPVFRLPGAYDRWEVLWAIYGYAIQIYADFSGYTDIAIGIALLLGIQFPLNFDSPYIATSLQDFWRRWHMTLSRWLRDYLYIPLGGNRGSEAEVARNIMLTMILGGLWHGAAWTFLAWGFLHGAGQVVGHVRRERRAATGLPPLVPSRLHHVGQVIFTFQFVCLAWIFFRATSFTNAFAVIGRIFTGWGAASNLVTPLVILTIVAVLLVQQVPTSIGERVAAAWSNLHLAVQAILLALVLLAITTLGPTGVAPFIYYRF